MGHCLADGNKRLAWICFTQALVGMHLSFAAEVGADHAETLCLTVIREHLNHAQVASRILGWLREER